ncbi:MAG: hypothetical protein RJQ00_04785 [Vicingaceae bacterium]
MKKILIVILLVPFAFSGFAQEENQVTKLYIFKSSGEENELLSKNGHQVLPKKGDWALGINASSLLQYFGNLANNETFNSSPRFNQIDKNLPTATVWGKYFIADDLAWRGGLDIFADADRDRFRINDDNSLNPDDALFDVRDINRYGFTASAGIEKRKGKSRVQGVYGADVYFHYTTNNTTTIEYGNEITQSNQNPSSTNFGNPTGIPTPALGYRLIEADFGNDFEVGLRGFIGVEYFFAPKISIGGEFYWGLSYVTTGESSVTFEGYEGSTNEVLESSTFSEGNRDLEIGFRNTSASVNLFFYF